MISPVGGSSLPLTTGLASPARPATEAPVAAARLVTASAQSSVDGSLQLTTREGDTVTIAAHADASATYANLRGRTADGRFSARYASLETNQSLSVQVQGDLSAEELADVEKVVKAFFHDLRAAFRGTGGGGEPASAGAAADAPGSTLANFTVHIDSTHSASAAVATVIAKPQPAPLPVPVTPVAGGDDGAPVAVAIAKPQPAPMPVTPVAGGDDGDADDAATGAARRGVDVAGLVERLSNTLAQAKLSPERATRVLDHVFGQFQRTLTFGAQRSQLAHVLAALRQSVAAGTTQAAPPEATPDTAPVELPATA